MIRAIGAWPGVQGISMQAINDTRSTDAAAAFSKELEKAARRISNGEDTIGAEKTENNNASVAGSQSSVSKTSTAVLYQNTLSDTLTDESQAVKVSLDSLGSYDPVTAYDSYFTEASEIYNIPVSLLKAVAKVESNFTETAVSGSGAMGVMQLMPTTAQAMGVSDAFDAQQNILGGAKCLALHLNDFDGDVSLALAAYNAGAGAVKRAGGIPSTAVANYVQSVLSNLS